MTDCSGRELQEKGNPQQWKSLSDCSDMHVGTGCDEAWWYYSRRDDLRTGCLFGASLSLAVPNPAEPNHRPVARNKQSVSSQSRCSLVHRTFPRAFPVFSWQMHWQDINLGLDCPLMPKERQQQLTDFQSVWSSAEMVESKVGLEKMSSLFRVSRKMYRDLDILQCVSMATEVKITGDSFIKKEIAPGIWGWWEDSEGEDAYHQDLLYSQDPHGRRSVMIPRCSPSDLNICAVCRCTHVYKCVCAHTQ